MQRRICIVFLWKALYRPNTLHNPNNPNNPNIRFNPLFFPSIHQRRRRMSNLYRIYPTLWEGQGCYSGQTVYAVDRTPPSNTFPTTCSARPRADPACTWESPTFQRILPPPTSTSGCWGGTQAVTWSTLPAWISYIQTLGYTLSENTSLGKLKPYGDLYIVGP